MPAYAFKDYLQLFVSGVSTGAIYVLIALGLIAIYRVTNVINLAQGEFAMLGAMLAVTFYQGMHLPLVVSALASVLGVSVIGGIIQRLTIHPARNAPDVTLIIITIGTAIALRGLALLAWGTVPFSLPDFSSGPPLSIYGAILSRQRVWIMGVAFGILVLLYLFFEFTMLGKAVHACAIDRRAAALMGINAEAMSLLSYVIGAGMSAVAGIVIAPLTLVSYNMGLSLGLKGFVVAIMGAMVNPLAAVLGGILLGVVESFASGLLFSGIKDAIAFFVLFLVLLGRTVSASGLSGESR